MFSHVHSLAGKSRAVRNYLLQESALYLDVVMNICCIAIIRPLSTQHNTIYHLTKENTTEFKNSYSVLQLFSFAFTTEEDPFGAETSCSQNMSATCIALKNHSPFYHEFMNLPKTPTALSNPPFCPY